MTTSPPANTPGGQVKPYLNEDGEDWRPHCPCGEPIKLGDRVLREMGGGWMHLGCCDYDGFVDEADEPLAPDAPCPIGFVWTQSNEDDYRL